LAELEARKSSDGWVGDPDGLLARAKAEDSPRKRFFGFYSFNLTRRIFLANFIALAVLLVGSILVSQPQGGFSKAAKDYFAEQANFSQAVAQNLLDRSFGGSNFEALNVVGESMPVHAGLSVVMYTDGGEKAFSSVSKMYNTGSVEASDYKSSGLWEDLSRIFGVQRTVSEPTNLAAFEKNIIERHRSGKSDPVSTVMSSGNSVYGVARPLTRDGSQVGYLVVHTPPELITMATEIRTSALFSFFLVASGVALVFAAILARAITNPLNDLARAAEIGKTADLGYNEAHKALIPNLAGRTDVIGRLSGAMSDMTSALYERIATNESFAADVAHEIKNPLASMRSAVETLRVAKEGKGKYELLDILEMDVRRLDRLVSDISNASRLDAELVHEETERFDLTKMLSNIVEFHKMEANDIGIDLIWEAPSKPIAYDGLEERLAQVFVNLVTNAISFCGKGDAVRVWCRLRGNRVLAVVEDTGPGIPDGSLEQIFRRFYSQRPTDDFGNHSGLGLAISKQIVEAHGGTIWAENIRKGDDMDLPVLGARFVVGFPV
jgi:two-component system sensor histidine kinase ChvG